MIRLSAVMCLLLTPLSASGEVTTVTITSRRAIADGRPFRSAGPYERLIGRIEFALAEDLDAILERAKSHWSFATRVQAPGSAK